MDDLLLAGNGPSDKIGVSVARWMPAGISRFEVAGLYEPDGDLARAIVIYEGPFEERVSTLAVKVPRDPRPLCDEVPLLLDNGAIFGGMSADLVSWCFGDSGRVVSLPMEPMQRFMLAIGGRLRFLGRYEDGVSECQARYQRWERVWMPLLDLRPAIAPYRKVRGHIEAPDGVEFCRLPGCNQMARYPSSGKGVWCWRHYQMSQGRLPMKHETLAGAKDKKRRVDWPTGTADRARPQEGVAGSAPLEYADRIIDALAEAEESDLTIDWPLDPEEDFEMSA